MRNNIKLRARAPHVTRQRKEDVHNIAENCKVWRTEAHGEEERSLPRSDIGPIVPFSHFVNRVDGVVGEVSIREMRLLQTANEHRSAAERTKEIRSMRGAVLRPWRRGTGMTCIVCRLAGPDHAGRTAPLFEARRRPGKQPRATNFACSLARPMTAWSPDGAEAVECNSPRRWRSINVRGRFFPSRGRGGPPA